MIYKFEYYFASAPNDVRVFECSASDIYEALDIFNSFKKTYKENIQTKDIYEVELWVLTLRVKIM